MSSVAALLCPLLFLFPRLLDLDLDLDFDFDFDLQEPGLDDRPLPRDWLLVTGDLARAELGILCAVD